MPSLTKDQQNHIKLAQFAHAVKNGDYGKTIFSDWLEDAELNIKLNLRNKSHEAKALTGSTPLHIAGIYYNIDAFIHLLDRGADFTEKDESGQTILHRLFEEKYSKFGDAPTTRNDIIANEFVHSILKAHVVFGISTNPHSSGGLSHFHIACAANDMEAVKLFLSGQLSVNEHVNQDSPMFSGYTALHFAASYGSYETTELLLEHGADLSAKDSQGLTPLHVVIRNLLIVKSTYDDKPEVWHQFITDNENMTRLFLENNVVPKVDSMGFSKLHAACALSDSSLVRRFVQNTDVDSAVNANSHVWPGYTALHFAVVCDNMDAVQLLIRHGATVTNKNDHGVTPFDICSKNYDNDVLYNLSSVAGDIKDIIFSDNQTKLIDFIQAIRSPSMFREFLRRTPSNVRLPINCPLMPGCSLLHLAVYFSQPDYVVEPEAGPPNFWPVATYLESEGSTVLQDVQGQTPLHLAFRQRKFAIVDMLLNNRLSFIDVADNEGLSHLHLACARCKIVATKELLTNLANVNAKYVGQSLILAVESGFTPLHVAVCAGKESIVKLLLDYSADVKITDAKGMTPIHHILTTYPRALKISVANLLFTTANVQNSVSDAGITHLHIATFIGNTAAVENLLQIGDNINATILGGEDLAESLLPDTLSGCTPLHLAIIAKHAEVTKLLLENGADLFGEGLNGMKPFCLVLESLTQEKEESCIETFAALLVNYVNFQDRLELDTGITFLHIACARSDFDLIRLLMTDPRWDTKTKLDVKDRVRQSSPIWPKATPLHLLIRYGKLEDMQYVMKLLLDCGADVTLKDGHGETPVHILLQRDEHLQHISALRMLLKSHKNFSINPTDKQGMSHFHAACVASQFNIVEKFLANGFDVNQPIDFRDRTLSFQTALHLLLFSQSDTLSDADIQLKTLDVLLNHGADVNVQDEKCSTVLLAAARGNILDYLLIQKIIKAGADINYINTRGESVSEATFTSKDFKMIICESDKKLRKSILDQLLQYPDLFEVDATPIHNIVVVPESNFTFDEFVDYISKFEEMGFDIDARDKNGESALHKAVRVLNDSAVKALLSCGADVNITDYVKSQTAFRKLLKSVNQVPRTLSVMLRFEELKKVFAVHIAKLQLCKLEIHANNQNMADCVISETRVGKNCSAILKEIKIEIDNTNCVIVGQGTLTLNDFLSNTEAIADRLLMIFGGDRKICENIFDGIDLEKFPHLSCVFKSQRKSIFKRLRFLEKAKDNLKKNFGSLNGFSIPETCCLIILKHLTTDEIERFIMRSNTE